MARPLRTSKPLEGGIPTPNRAPGVGPFEITHDMPHYIWVAGIAGGDGLSKVVGIRGSGGDQIRHRSGISPAHEKRKDDGHLQPSSLARHPVHRRPSRSQGGSVWFTAKKPLAGFVLISIAKAVIHMDTKGRYRDGIKSQG